jgi:hypothetical protein
MRNPKVAKKGNQRAEKRSQILATLSPALNSS